MSPWNGSSAARSSTRRPRPRRSPRNTAMGATEMPRLLTLPAGVAAIAVSMLSAGCASVGPDYKRPEMQPPAQFRFVESPAQATSLADAPWFQVFEDPTLQGLIRDAIASNLDLRAAAARVEEARARAGIAKSFLYPQVDGIANYSVRQASTTEKTDDTTHQSGNYGFVLSWE